MGNSLYLRVKGAGRETLDDYHTVNRYLEERRRSACSYERGDIDLGYLVSLLTLPVQFFSRLSGDNYWRMEKENQT